MIVCLTMRGMQVSVRFLLNELMFRVGRFGETLEILGSNPWSSRRGEYLKFKQMAQNIYNHNQ